MKSIFWIVGIFVLMQQGIVIEAAASPQNSSWSTYWKNALFFTRNSGQPAAQNKQDAEFNPVKNENGLITKDAYTFWLTRKMPNIKGFWAPMISKMRTIGWPAWLSSDWKTSKKITVPIMSSPGSQFSPRDPHLRTAIGCDKIIKIVVPVNQQGDFLRVWPTGSISTGPSVWEAIVKQESGNCGYHALSNVVWVAQALSEGTSLNVSLAQQHEQYVQFMKLAFPAIAASRGNNQSVNWLGGGELENLLKKIKSTLSVPIIIVEHVALEGFEFAEHVLKAAKNFAENKNQLLGLVWNSGLRSNVRDMGGSHWVSFVAQHADGNIKLYYMNSLTGIDPNFQKVAELVCSSPQQLQAMIDQPVIAAMNADVEVIQDRLTRAQGGAGEVIFEQYIDCVPYHGQYITEFTAQMLPALNAHQLASLNNNWKLYLATKRPAALTFVAARFYTVWMHANHACNALDVSISDCAQAAQKYKDKALLIDGKNRSIISQNDSFELMINTCLTHWNKNIVWPIGLQAKIAKLLVSYLQIEQARPSMSQARVKTVVDEFLKKLSLFIVDNPWYPQLLQEALAGEVSIVDWNARVVTRDASMS